MRVFITVIVLIFSLQSWTKADDIRDFEIEGISIGDSLLDFANEEKIKSIISKDQYPNDKFTIYDVEKILKLKNYEYMTLTTKKNDDNYIVTGVGGVMNYKKLDDCLEKKKSIQNDIEKLLTYNAKEEVKYPSQRDKTGNSIIYGVQYYFKAYPSVEGITINCSHFTTESNIVRTLKVSAESEEYAYFIINEAYK